MSYQAHQAAAQSISARFAVITLSDTRTRESDTSGQRIQQLIRDAGHAVTHYELIHDDPVVLESLCHALLQRDDVDVIVTNGGTGVSRRDRTITAIERLLTQRLEGFGELFRMLSFHQIGSGAMLSNAVGGVIRDGQSANLVFALPGSVKAVELAMVELILKEVQHLLHELRK